MHAFYCGKLYLNAFGFKYNALGIYGSLIPFKYGD